MGELTGGTVTFLFTDIEGSTRLLRALGDRYPAVLLRQRALIGGAAEAAGGHAFGNEGDAVFLAFHEPGAALQAAADAQRAIATEPWPEDGPIRVRMGIHTGEAAMLGDDYVGLALHETARVAAAGHGGQVLVSSATAELSRRALPEGLGLRDLGDHRLKDLTGPQRLFQLTGDGLPDGFPVLRSLEGRPNNLPAQLTSFVGRDQLAQAVELLGRTRLLTLTGPGGTGKTRLALQVAAEALEGFADGTWFVPLETVTDPALAPSEILGAMGVQPAANQPPLDRLREHLAGRSALLVLDNLEQVVSIGPLVTRLLREAPGIKVLATSRIPLHVTGEQELPVPPLGLPDDADPTAAEAVRLFVERALAVQPGFALTPETGPAVARIVWRLDGLPLAIELAAARVRTLSLEAIEARLGTSLALLTGGARDLPERQRTLRGAIDWSHDLLDEPERRLFARLGVFAGGADLDLVEQVCGSAAELGIEPLDGLESLADKSLLRPVPGAAMPRFAMLVTIRGYALERLDASGEGDAIRERHLAAMLALAEEAAPHLTGPEARGRLDRLSLEHDNLRAALDLAVERGDLERAERLATALWRFWQIRGHLHEAQERLERLLTQPGAGDVSPQVLATALIAAGSVAYWRGDAPGMRRWYGAAVTAAERCGDRRTLADALYNLGFAPDDEEGDGTVLVFALRRPVFERALGLYRELGDRQGMARSAWALGLGELYSDEPGPARRHNLEARDLARVVGDRFYEAWATWDLALLDLMEGDIPAAREGLRSALAMFEAMDDRSGPVLVLQGVALLARRAGDEARHWLLRGAVERLRVATGVDLVRQRLDALGWNYLEQPPDDGARAAWDAGLALGDDAVWRIAGELLRPDLERAYER